MHPAVEPDIHISLLAHRRCECEPLHPDVSTNPDKIRSSFHMRLLAREKKACSGLRRWIDQQRDCCENMNLIPRTHGKNEPGSEACIYNPCNGGSLPALAPPWLSCGPGELTSPQHSILTLHMGVKTGKCHGILMVIEGIKT